MLKRFQTWLRNVPIADPVDRRNAPVMQMLFLLMGIATPALWAFHIATAGMPRGGTLALITTLMLAGSQLYCFGLIRFGHFRPAIRLYLVAVLTSLMVDYLHVGFHAIGAQQIDHFMTLVISALVLGRPAFWAVFVVLQAITVSGFAVDFYRADSVHASFANLLTAVVSQLLFALVLERSVNALREALAESNQRGHALQHEMQARERAQSQLIHAQKMEASGRLASGIAHDFNNILGVILGFAAQRHPGEENGRPRAAMLEESLEGVEIAARRGEAISRKLLRFSRHDVAHVETFDAGQAIEDVRPLLRQMFDAQVRLHVDIGNTALPVRLDRSQFELMLLNIAANARDAMPGGGVFTVAASRARSTGAERIEIRLTDSGDGMSDAVARRAFEPFYSTKPVDSGTGLGLAVVHDLVVQAGGTIGLDSTPGQGTTFRISLPAAGTADGPGHAPTSAATGTT